MAGPEYIMGDKITYYNPNNFDIDPQTICYDPRTTLMVRNIPNKYTIQDLSYEIDLDFANRYDFLYLPCDINVFFFIISEQLQRRIRVYQLHQHWNSLWVL